MIIMKAFQRVAYENRITSNWQKLKQIFLMVRRLSLTNLILNGARCSNINIYSIIGAKNFFYRFKEAFPPIFDVCFDFHWSNVRSTISDIPPNSRKISRRLFHIIFLTTMKYVQKLLPHQNRKNRQDSWPKNFLIIFLSVFLYYLYQLSCPVSAYNLILNKKS